MKTTARRNPDGDSALWRQLIVGAKCVILRATAPRGRPVDPPEKPYLVVPILGQSNAFGMGLGIDLHGLDAPHPRAVPMGDVRAVERHRLLQLAADPLLHELPGRGVGFGVTFAKHLADETGRNVLLIPGARGDTSFTPKNGYTWDPFDAIDPRQSSITKVSVPSTP